MRDAPAPTPAEVFAAYATWLDRQPLAFNTCVTYRRQVQRFCAWLATTRRGEGDPLREPNARDAAVRCYKMHLQTVMALKPASVNAALAAITHFYHFLGLPRPRVTREERQLQAPRALDGEEQQCFLAAVEHQGLATTWNGAWTRRIHVALDWKRRSR